MRKAWLLLSAILLSACGDFPDYRYDQSEDYCALSFPFAGGLLGRKYVGYFNIVSSLQYLDADPEMEIYIGEPSHIDLEIGSVQKVLIAGKEYKPVFHKSYTNGDFQYWGPAFTFDQQQAQEIYNALQEGNNLSIHGRLEIGKQYETDVYNFFFDSNEKHFRACINRLLDDEDLIKLQQIKAESNEPLRAEEV